MYRILLSFLLIFFFVNNAVAVPKIKLIHKRGADNLAKIQIKNESNRNVKCYVSIDGHKKHFKLGPLRTSKTYMATHKKFNYNHFSVSCDYA
jgi:hypothetical protein